MKLLVQGDDFGFTRGVTLGIVDSIDFGILRNTGLFANMPSTEFAVSFMKDRPQACFGIDFNLVSGRPVSDPTTVPHLVDENGEFIRSGARTRDARYQTEAGRREMFPADETYREIRAQYDRFVELTGKKPGYLHGHSIMPEPYLEAIRRLSKETGVEFSMDLCKEMKVGSIPLDPKMFAKKVFDPAAQLAKDPIADVLKNSELLLSYDIAMVGGHPGYIDAELLSLTTLSLERCKDAEMCMSDQIKQWVQENQIELITYDDLVRMKKAKEVVNQ